ncbi:hypothetical protein EV651_12517 [Kribbella sp. VKM Ac-2571]|uniref:hypothetical protein n=1 Tax=Kribbella sp. VKM Ac-2571 TaxID=2512222 RepID=UPI0010F14D4F|nr:hypothetical protein [Kribbella sp. VKM Ac-2571]TDO47024.1 hypothetical protein EV651_12517 [Kribbella sp. VKM Ac-2571]
MTGFVIFVVVMIVVGLINKAKQQSGGGNAKQNARMQAVIERIQAQQGGNQPVQFQGQFTQAAGPGGPPPAPIPGQMQTGTAQGSQQAAAVLQQLLQNGRQPRHMGERNSPGQAAQQPGFGTPYQPPAQFQPSQYPAQYPVQYNPGPYQPPAHRPQQNNLPSTKQDLDARVRDLMKAGHEVGAIRLLSDEREMGILEAQKYARTLVAPPAAQQGTDVPDEPDEERYVGSAAFAESIFNVNDRDENVWASGWVDVPEPEDRSDIEELWQTVSNPPRATPPTSQ